MSITPVSSGSNTGLSPFGESNAIKLLEKQKMQLQDQIQKTNESKMDDKTKRELVKQLQDQIQQIDMEIQQRRTEKISINQNANQYASEGPVNSVGENSENSESMAGIHELLQAGAIYSQSKLISETKNNLMGKGRILKKEIELDEARSLSGGKAAAKRKELQKIEASERGIDKKLADANQVLKKKIDTAVEKAVNSDNSKINEENGEEVQEQNKDANNYKKIDIKI